MLEPSLGVAKVANYTPFLNPFTWVMGAKYRLGRRTGWFTVALGIAAANLGIWKQNTEENSL